MAEAIFRSVPLLIPTHLRTAARERSNGRVGGSNTATQVDIREAGNACERQHRDGCYIAAVEVDRSKARAALRQIVGVCMIILRMDACFLPAYLDNA